MSFGMIWSKDEYIFLLSRILTDFYSWSEQFAIYTPIYKSTSKLLLIMEQNIYDAKIFFKHLIDMNYT